MLYGLKPNSVCCNVLLKLYLHSVDAKYGDALLTYQIMNVKVRLLLDYNFNLKG